MLACCHLEKNDTSCSGPSGSLSVTICCDNEDATCDHTCESPLSNACELFLAWLEKQPEVLDLKTKLRTTLRCRTLDMSTAGDPCLILITVLIASLDIRELSLISKNDLGREREGERPDAISKPQYQQT